jgi:hypothetical protein
MRSTAPSQRRLAGARHFIVPTRSDGRRSSGPSEYDLDPMPWEQGVAGSSPVAPDFRKVLIVVDPRPTCFDRF